MGSDGLLMTSPINANAPPDDERKRWRPFCAGLSHNQPSVEPALAELLRKHPSLVSVELVEHSDRHLPTRAKDEIGRALLENKSRKLSFLHCDMCVRTFMTDYHELASLIACRLPFLSACGLPPSSASCSPRRRLMTSDDL
jgi:hypothetical protein